MKKSHKIFIDNKLSLKKIKYNINIINNFAETIVDLNLENPYMYDYLESEIFFPINK